LSPRLQLLRKKSRQGCFAFFSPGLNRAVFRLVANGAVRGACCLSQARKLNDRAGVCRTSPQIEQTLRFYQHGSSEKAGRLDRRLPNRTPKSSRHRASVERGSDARSERPKRSLSNQPPNRADTARLSRWMATRKLHDQTGDCRTSPPTREGTAGLSRWAAGDEHAGRPDRSLSNHPPNRADIAVLSR
jgi:hypothetical protein